MPEKNESAAGRQEERAVMADVTHGVDGLPFTLRNAHLGRREGCRMRDAESIDRDSQLRPPATDLPPGARLGDDKAVARMLPAKPQTRGIHDLVVGHDHDQRRSFRHRYPMLSRAARECVFFFITSPPVL